MSDPADLRCQCPGCGHDLWDRRRGEWTLGNRILKLTGQHAFSAKCPSCGDDVAVPWLGIVEHNVPPPADPKKTPLVKAVGPRRAVVRRAARRVLVVDNVPKS